MRGGYPFFNSKDLLEKAGIWLLFGQIQKPAIPNSSVLFDPGATRSLSLNDSDLQRAACAYMGPELRHKIPVDQMVTGP